MAVSVMVAVGGVYMKTGSVGIALYAGAFLGWAVYTLALVLGFLPVVGPILFWLTSDWIFSFVGVEPLPLLKIFGLVESIAVNAIVAFLIYALKQR
ncbi:hypothetical protein [Pyrobaculum neutrophilum]|uniref:Uncharacterized protein n=1 Tax=Pyrobaculum neutrophilum (strain DSM 2338 / JCM 9278 / NBRC 100436 / V24Sta) TaxID=444157 RepID=B1YD70_PYRNV|nr:hypothetical protein [Pyrobaculum neutrophilum]ACB39733.1 hypothetical protein Tneu_0794 [Pyrobaculum neutrophilum V24Sta]